MSHITWNNNEIHEPNKVGRKNVNPFTIGTWIVRGLTHEIKQIELNEDCEKLKIAIMAIQETKMCEFMEKL